MDFSPTDYQRQLKATAHEFMERECPRDRLLELGKTDTGHDAGIWRKAADIGFLGALIPESYGGAGGSLTDAAMICEEFGRGPLPGPYFSSSVLGNLVLQECGAEDQKAELLPGVANGEEVVALALTEAGYGWDAGSISLQAEPQGDKFVLNGTKLFVHDALSATRFLCVARCASGPEGNDIGIFLVGADAGGVSRRRVIAWCATT